MRWRCATAARAGSRWMRTASSSSSTRPRCGISSSEELEQAYYPEVAALIQRLSGAKRVHVFDHTLRSGNEAEREARLLREPVLSAHNDYTDWSGPNRVRELMGERGRNAARAAFCNHSGLAGDQPADPVQPARHRRRQERRARRSPDRRAPLPAPRRADLPAEVQPAAPLVLLSRRCAATRRWCSRCTTRRKTGARASRRTRRSRIRPRRRARRRARASKPGRWCFSRRAALSASSPARRTPSPARRAAR